MDLKTTKNRVKDKEQLADAIKLADAFIKTLEDGKAEDIIKIDLAGKADFAHFMIIASGRSSKHISSLAEDIEHTAEDMELYVAHTEGQNTGEWVLIDAIDVVVHLFKPETRANYDLERMWGFEVKS